ncbi:MAG: hypothetical protein LBD21_06315 [Tannerellaceae bacterium]|jgi:hypothetical protein|nr:hypothetical protein [Tannerellaceae bacterium]
MKALQSIFISLLALSAAYSQNNVTMLNRGKMCVSDTLYIKGSFQAEAASAISQKGYTIITGDLINNATGAGHVFTLNNADNSGSLEFAGSQPQTIRGSASKTANYINFPGSLIINNTSADGSVVLKADKSATAQNITVRSGRLVLDSEPVPNERKSNQAHLLVEGTVTTGIQVNLAMGTNSQSGYLAGFCSPFEALYADYFFFNFLTKPTNSGLFGDNHSLISYPRTRLEPGMGYIIGMGIVPDGDPYYTSARDPRWADADPSKRAKDMFRFLRAYAEPTFTKYLDETNAPGSTSLEKLNTKDVKVSLRTGFNYIGNPYTAPLDLHDIVNQTNLGDWGVSSSVMENGFYVLYNGQGTTTDKETYTFTASYLKRQTVGSTHSVDDMVAPMQMFVVGAKSPVTLTIPKSRRVHEPVAYFRSASNPVIDELLIETRDNETQGFDRLCIVFRSDASLAASDFYDAPKIFNYSRGVNQIYTRSSDNQTLSSSIIPPTTRELAMYFEPSAVPQRVTLRADRLESISAVAAVILEDTKTGVRTNLLQTPEYSFSSSPSDRADRFVLHFSDLPTGTESVEGGKVGVSYAGGEIVVQGLSGSDIGSTAVLYNTGGQTLHSASINEISPLRINKMLGKGVYLLKIRTRSYKFVVL